MTDYTTGEHSWRQLRLYDPDFLSIDVKFNLVRSQTRAWGGFNVIDGDSMQTIEVTAQHYEWGLPGIERILSELRHLLYIHVMSSGPFD
jgi:hypothetical protein